LKSGADPVPVSKAIQRIISETNFLSIVEQEFEFHEEFQRNPEILEVNVENIPSFFSKFKSGIQKIVWSIFEMIFSKQTLFAIAVATGIVLMALFLWWI